MGQEDSSQQLESGKHEEVEKSEDVCDVRAKACRSGLSNKLSGFCVCSCEGGG